MSRATCRLVASTLGAVALVTGAAAATAQQPATRDTVAAAGGTASPVRSGRDTPRRGLDVRVGAMFSTPLAHDEGAWPRPGQPVPAEEAYVRAAPGPLAAMALWAELAPALELEMSAGWTFSQVLVHEDGGRRSVGPLGIGHAVVAIRHDIQDFRVRGGVGAVTYVADAGIFRGSGRQFWPVAEGGVGGTLRIGHVRVGLELMAQVHSFGTPALREAGGLDGTIVRYGVHGGFLLGGSP